MSNENRTLSDWPVGTTGTTMRGVPYEIVYHHKNGKQMLVVLFSETGYESASWRTTDADVLIHPEDAMISIFDDLTNPNKIPICSLDMESRKALDEVGWAGLDVLFPYADNWTPSSNSDKSTPLSSRENDAEDIIYRARPQPKMRQMTAEEARSWAAKQPDSVFVMGYAKTMVPARNRCYDGEMEHYRWVDVNKGGGWKPLPMVEEA